MMDCIPDTSVRPNEPCANERIGNGLPGCFHPGDFGEKPQKPQRTLCDTVKDNTEVIAGCCGLARRISTFLLNSCDENMNVNKPEIYCLIDEIECQRIDLNTLHTILSQIMAELGA